MTRRLVRRAVVAIVCPLGVLMVVTGSPVLAHGGGFRAAGGRDLTVPLWLFLATGGGVIGASFLLSTFVTDRRFVRRIREWEFRLRVPASGLLTTALRATGLLGLAAVLTVALVGPQEAMHNAAVLLVWVGWWAGLVGLTYLVGNIWPVMNPWRTLADRLPSRSRAYPHWLGAWPCIGGLFLIVYAEVVGPFAADPRLLGGAVVVYSTATLIGAVAFGPDQWFGTADPIARLFRYYGRVAPLASESGVRDGRIQLRLPGMGLVDSGFITGRSESAFVVALLWATTYDGFVTTAAWVAIANQLVGLGLPASLVYLGLLLGGFAVFLGAFRGAVRLSRVVAESHRSVDDIATRFAPSLLAIAAGYHLAHVLGYLLALLPQLGAALTTPLASPRQAASTVTSSPVAVPQWVGWVELAIVLLGHLLAIWVAHATAFDLFPSRLQAIRSQYALVGVMVLYTIIGLWIVSRPYAPPPFVGQ